MNGRNMFMGYLNMKDKTIEAFDDDLWVRSGDIGKKDDDGFLYITGRIKGNGVDQLASYCSVAQWLGHWSLAGRLSPALCPIYGLQLTTL